MHIIVNNVVSNKMYRNGIPMWDCGWKEPRDFNTPFYIEDISGSVNTLSIVKSADGNPTLDIEYSTDLNTWNLLGSTSLEPLTLTIPANSKVYLRCECNAWNQNKISCSGNHNVGGNILSLQYGSSFNAQTEAKNSQYAFKGFMTNNTHVVNASKLNLPATYKKGNGFENAFQGCTSLVSGPYMPTTLLYGGDYQGMFDGCSALTKVSDLPITRGVWQGCRNMFRNCTSLVNPPVMDTSMTSVAYEAFENMFSGCTSLIKTPSITFDNMKATAFIRGMFDGCTSLMDASGIIINASQLTFGDYEMRGAFRNCSSMTKPPTINVGGIGANGASNLFTGCSSLTSMVVTFTSVDAGGCGSMFDGCTSLSDVTCYITSGFGNCGNWMRNVAANGIFRKPAEATGWSEGASGIPTGWTVVDL